MKVDTDVYYFIRETLLSFYLAYRYKGDEFTNKLQKNYIEL